MRMMKDKVTACSGPKTNAPKLSTTPRANPPTMAPGTLPKPPRTQMMKALPRKMPLFKGEIG